MSTRRALLGHMEDTRELGLDPDTETPGRLVVRHIGESLVKAMEMARESDTPDAAQRVATARVVLAETLHSRRLRSRAAAS